MFNEDNTIEQMVISTLKGNGWKYIAAEDCLEGILMSW